MVFRSFHIVSIGSVGQRAANLRQSNFENDSDLIGVKPGLHACVQLGPGGRLFLRTPPLTASNFAAL